MFWGTVSGVRADEIDDYQRSFDAYRQAYSVFEVDQADYTKTQTFAAEEALINSAREMLLFRADSWLNYWKTLAARYATVASAADESRSNWKSFFEAENIWLTEHKTGLTQQKVRKGLLEETNKLNNLKEGYSIKAYQMNVEIISGKMKDAIIQVRKVNEVLLDKAKAQQMSPDQQETIIRGLTANIERLNQLEADAAVVRQDFINQSGFADEGEFTSISQDFSPLYQQLRQLTSITRELAKDIQW